MDFFSRWSSWYTVCFLFLLLVDLLERAHNFPTHNEFLYIRVVRPGRKCDDDGDKRWWTLVCVCLCAKRCDVRACCCVSKFVYYFAMNKNTSRLMCSSWNSAPDLLWNEHECARSSRYFRYFVHSLCSTFEKPEFKRFWCVWCERASVFLCFYFYCTFHHWIAHTTHMPCHAAAVVELSETYSVARFTFNTRKCQ